MDQPGDNRSGQGFGFQQNTSQVDVNSDRARHSQETEASRLDAIPIPQDIPFSNSNPTSFAQISSNIGQPITSATSLSANIYSHTLSQYGPAIIEQQQPDSPILRPQIITTPVILSKPMGGIEINPEYNFVGLNDTRPAPAAITTSSTAPNHLLFTRPASITSTTSAAPLSDGPLVLNKDGALESTRDDLVYSPPLIDREDALAINPNSGRPMGLDGRIPKKSNDKTPVENAETLLDLQKLYRSYDDKFKCKKSSRDRLDRDISSMMRGHRGQNIELDPIFCKMKDQKKRHESEMDRIEADLKRVEAKMMARFNYRMARQNDTSDPISSQPAQPGKRQTAKMSTGTAYNNSKIDNKSVDKKDIILDLRDTNTWCNVCDLHFNNLREFAKHLHGHEHCGRTRKSTPWRHNNTATTKWDKNKTYQTMKSICSKLTNENDRNFTVNDVDRILNPNLDAKEPEIKSRFVARERGRFDDDDPLFKIRGYDLIVPMNGFYCQLCSRALCDSLELEKHVMSYEHTYCHLKSMSLNSEHERKLRVAFIKSYQKEFPPIDEEIDIERGRGNRSSDDRRRDSSPSQQPQAAPRAYKKLTSSIVDDHEALRGLVPPATKRPPLSSSTDDIGSKESTTAKVASAVDGSPGKRRRYESSVPVIEPLSKTTGALQRLKNSTSRAGASVSTRKSTETREDIEANDMEPITSSSEDDIGADEHSQEKQQKQPGDVRAIDKMSAKKAKKVVDEAKVVDADDPNNLFPGIRLSMYSNQHDDLLTDKRLAQQCVIKLTKIDLNDYKDLIIMDSSSKWSRIDALMAKRENIKDITSDAVTKTTTEPTFFSLDGQRIPLDLDELARDSSSVGGDARKVDRYDNLTMKPPSSTTGLGDKTTNSNRSSKKIITEEFETGDNGDDAVDDSTTASLKKETKSVKNEVMFTDEENEEEKPVDVNSYMTALNDFFLEK